MKPGKYKVSASNWGLATTSTGRPQVFVQFKTEENETITWYGLLDSSIEKAFKYSLKTLAILGFTSDKLVDLAVGNQGTALDSSKAVEVEIENHEYNGKTNLRVKWINALSTGLTTSKDAVEAVRTMDIRGEMLAIRNDLGIKNERPSRPNSASGTSAPNVPENVPF